MHAAEAPSASDGAASAIPSTMERIPLGTGDNGGGGGGGGDGGSGGDRGGDLNGIAHATGASMTPSSPFLAPPAEQLCCQPSPTSTLPAPRADKHSEMELLQQRRQQHLLSRAPAFSSSFSSSSCPPSSRRYRQLAALSASAGEEDCRGSQHLPVGLPRAAATTAAASVGAPRQRRRRHSPPIRAARGAAAASASTTSAPMPTGRTARAAAAGSHAPERDGSKGERRKSAAGRVGGRTVLRRRASTGASTGAGEGTGGGGAFQADPFASRGGRRQGFDAAPYQTTVLFRDR